MESKSGVCTPNTYVKSAKNRGEILVPVVLVNTFLFSYTERLANISLIKFNMDQ